MQFIYNSSETHWVDQRAFQIASISGSNCVTSWTLAPVRIVASRLPLASETMWCLEPGRAWSVVGPEQSCEAHAVRP